MNSSELITAFRGDVDDVAQPQLWSDSEIAGYADDAQKMFCRLTGGLRDATSQLCEVDMEVGEAFADIDPRILHILRVQRNSDCRVLERINIEDLDSSGAHLDTKTGAVNQVIVGLAPNKLRWVSAPAVADTASMIVDRLPLVTISTARTTRLEVDEQHHRHLMLWMASLAYAKQDADTLDINKSESKAKQFRDYCELAKTEKERARRKVRTVAYGGL